MKDLVSGPWIKVDARIDEHYKVHLGPIKHHYGSNGRHARETKSSRHRDVSRALILLIHPGKR